MPLRRRAHPVTCERRLFSCEKRVSGGFHAARRGELGARSPNLGFKRGDARPQFVLRQRIEILPREQGQRIVFRFRQKIVVHRVNPCLEWPRNLR